MRGQEGAVGEGVAVGVHRLQGDAGHRQGRARVEVDDVDVDVRTGRGGGFAAPGDGQRLGHGRAGVDDAPAQVLVEARQGVGVGVPGGLGQDGAHLAGVEAAGAARGFQDEGGRARGGGAGERGPGDVGVVVLVAGAACPRGVVEDALAGGGHPDVLAGRGHVEVDAAVREVGPLAVGAGGGDGDQAGVPGGFGEAGGGGVARRGNQDDAVHQHPVHQVLDHLVVGAAAPGHVEHVHVGTPRGRGVAAAAIGNAQAECARTVDGEEAPVDDARKGQVPLDRMVDGDGDDAGPVGDAASADVVGDGGGGAGHAGAVGAHAVVGGVGADQLTGGAVETRVGDVGLQVGVGVVDEVVVDGDAHAGPGDARVPGLGGVHLTVHPLLVEVGVRVRRVGQGADARAGRVDRAHRLGLLDEAVGDGVTHVAATFEDAERLLHGHAVGQRDQRGLEGRPVVDQAAAKGAENRVEVGRVTVADDHLPEDVLLRQVHGRRAVVAARSPGLGGDDAGAAGCEQHE